MNIKQLKLDVNNHNFTKSMPVRVHNLVGFYFYKNINTFNCLLEFCQCFYISELGSFFFHQTSTGNIFSFFN